MKFIAFIAGCFLPLTTDAGWGFELAGGLNNHIGPISNRLIDKGTKPGRVLLLKSGWYFKKIEFGAGAEFGRWNYSNLQSGYPVYTVDPANGSVIDPEPKKYILGGNNYNLFYTFCNYNFVNRAILFSAGVAIGRLAFGRANGSTYSSRHNYVRPDGGIPGSSGFVAGVQLIIGYNLNQHIRVKVEGAARYNLLSFKASGRHVPPGYEMYHFPVTIGMVFHNFNLK